MNIKKQLLQLHSASSGFTLVEVLLATALSGIVITSAGFGLVTVLQENAKAEEQNLRQLDFNRALDFIAEEARMATSIQPGTGTTLLRLRVPGINVSANSGFIDYKLTALGSGSVWSGPRVIQRYGPNFANTGLYSDATSSTDWQNEVLVDGVEDTSITPSCPSGWTQSPSSGAVGFYACIDPTRRIADIYLRGSVDADNDNIRGSADATDDGPYIYTIKTRVFARGN